MIKIDLNDVEVIAAFNRLLAAGGNLKPVYQDIGEHLVDATKRRFSDGVAPDDARWAELSPITIARKGHAKPLIGESRRLGVEISYQLIGNGVEIGSPMEYAATQQFGAKARSFAGGKSPWGDIPPRPFLGISEADRLDILDILREHLSDK